MGSPDAKELLFAAARKGDSDADILVAAYSLASRAGWEDDPEVYQWLHKAAEVSGDDGPIQKASLKDILDRKPAWDRRESETWRHLNHGEIPMFVAGQLLNKSLIDLVLFPALANLSERDPRRRAVVPAYSGARHPKAINFGGAVGIEATALLTLSLVNLLDDALDAFEEVFIPHSMLAWLFEEQQKVAFHQPSRIRAAHQIRHFLATEVLEKLAPSTVPDSELSTQVGEELALLIGEAARASDEGDRQGIVVRSAPVHRVGSLMEEEADLTAYAAVLSSCQSIVDKLRQKGQITAEEEKKARSFFQLHEKPWPEPPEIADRAVLYLDRLSVSYFVHLGLLEKLKAAGFRPILPPWGAAEANELISYESISNKVSDAIERIRCAVSSRIETGKVRIGRRHNIDQTIEGSMLCRHQIRHFLATEVLEKLAPSTVPDSELSTQVGEELALLIGEAARASDEGDRQGIVVRSAPVHRVGSLMEEEADLTAYAAVLSSCQSIVDKLRQKGQITAEEEKKARSFFQLHEKPWPEPPEIADRAVLYLDRLSVSYFVHLGLLEKLKAAGFRPILPPWGAAEANELISYESISNKVSDAIERIRCAVSSRIETGKVRIGRRHNIDQTIEGSTSHHPTLDVFSLVAYCDAIITDDRFINQHANMDDSGGSTSIISTLDLIDELTSAGIMVREGSSESRTLLRRAGYIFVLVSKEELERHLEASSVENGKVIETAELKAVRENILQVRMSRWLQLPKETYWLDATLKTFIQALKGQWVSDSDLSTIRARSDWIVDQIDLRRWAHCLGAESGDNIVKVGRGPHILMLLSPPADASPKLKDEYRIWIEERILAPIKEQEPGLYSWMLAWTREQISETADMDLSEESAK